MLRVFTILILISFLFALPGKGQNIDSFYVYNNIRITVDRPPGEKKNKKSRVIFYALPNGNTTAQTMGKKMQPGDDWHYDIQHIRAQTRFIRESDKKTNYTVIYLENDYKSWPLWKQRNSEFKTIIPRIIDSLISLIPGKRKEVHLNGHSGGGSFIFGYLAGTGEIPGQVKRISFLDSNYGYDSSYYPVIKQWLKNNKVTALNVFAYNDSIALYNAKPVVSATGGTWYRGHLMLKHLQQDFNFSKSETDSLIIYKSTDNRIQFFFKKNLDRGIYHTQQVELNGFIHSVLCGSRFDSRGYTYYGRRSYEPFIR
jgi:pimeloyl-ACP methyl ester carboxylesterase